MHQQARDQKGQSWVAVMATILRAHLEHRIGGATEGASAYAPPALVMRVGGRKGLPKRTLADWNSQYRAGVGDRNRDPHLQP